MIYIEQPPFLPWLGFCESLLVCDEVALYDDVQYTDGGWQNRNRIKSANGISWLTVPVRKKFGRTIRDIQIAPSNEPRQLLEKIRHAYARTDYYSETLDVIAGPIEHGFRWLVDLNIALITSVATAIGSTARLTLTSSLACTGSGRMERIVGICQTTGNSILWAGEGTRSYLDVGEITNQGISVKWNEFASRHPEYRQAWPRQGFVPGLSVVDAACSIGWAGVRGMLLHGAAVHLGSGSRT
jgi:WbqC-like protein